MQNIPPVPPELLTELMELVTDETCFSLSQLDLLLLEHCPLLLSTPPWARGFAKRKLAEGLPAELVFAVVQRAVILQVATLVLAARTAPALLECEDLALSVNGYEAAKREDDFYCWGLKAAAIAPLLWSPDITQEARRLADCVAVASEKTAMVALGLFGQTGDYGQN